MSGVTLVTYRVDTAEEIEERARRAAWERYRAATSQLDVLQAQAAAYRSAYGNRVSKIPAAPGVRANAGAARIDAATAKVNELVREQRQVLQGEVAAAARADIGQALTAALGSVASTAADTADEYADRARQRRQAAEERAADIARRARERAEERRGELDRRAAQRRATLAERAVTLLSKVPETVESSVLEAYRQAAAEIAQTDSESRASILTEDLERRVVNDIARAEAVHTTGAELARLAARLEVVGGDSAAALRQSILDLIDGKTLELPADLTAQVETVVAEADRQRHQRMAAAAIQLGLAELGYDLDGGFATALVRDGAALTSLPGQAGYGVRVELDKKHGAVRTRVVKSRRVPASKTADTAAEKKYCDDHEALLQRLRRHGITTAELGRLPAGEQEMETVADELIPAARPAAQRPAYRQMESGS